ncbi:hypothetical protein [Paenibacillus sanfengchensis]|uniref:hypothetical protein n=1 Tax=Paenibacillus sanfengchensis TaxID=3119819 RepID=UPI002FE16AEF
MGKMLEYGFLCEAKDEKKLINALLGFLEPLNRTFSKTKNKGMLEARLPYVYRHFYWNLNKEMQVYVEIYPNQDADGKIKFSHPDVGWVLFVNLKEVSGPYHVPLDKQEAYLQDFLQASGFEFVELKEYRDDEERI